MSHLLSVIFPPLHTEYTYQLSDDLTPRIDVGHRVLVPFGRRNAPGFVVKKATFDGNSDALPYKLKSVPESSNHEQCFSEHQLEFFQWVADYYGESLASVIDTALPPPVPKQLTRTAVFLKDDAELKGSRQKEILAYLKSAKQVPFLKLTTAFANPRPALIILQKKGLIRIDEEESFDRLHETPPPKWAKTNVEMNTAQAEAFQSIRDCVDAGSFKSFLLHGVTGSGKTEVYIEAIKHVRSLGKGALIVVPEIALTPQVIDRFRARFDEDIAVLHSGLKKRARWNAWRALLDGRSAIAIGARSGIFAPVRDIGIIIVDEEHDGSYKQNEGFRYHARDLALVRGKLLKCPVILGSATPSLETFYNAAKKKYSYLSLPGRPDSSSTTTIELVDLNKIKPYEMITRNVSPRLHETLTDTINKNEQAFILYNRRGFACYLQCNKCDHVIKCPNCSVTLTLHREINSLVCHYCYLNLVPPQYCTSCESATPGKLAERGAGTERIYDELKELFPNVSIERLDRDAVDSISDYRAVIDRVRSGETQILVGTQMIAKGHDLPGVTLVGVADCDVGLHLPDFRAAERAFQLLTQAAGRAGRGDKPGIVILQTRVPKHPSLVATAKKDYLGFARLEVKIRTELGYPPLSKLLRIVTTSPDENVPRSHLDKIIKEIVGMKLQSLQILGPAPCPLERLKAEWRWHVLIKGHSAAQLATIVKNLKHRSEKLKTVRVVYDLDPQEMM